MEVHDSGVYQAAAQVTNETFVKAAANSGGRRRCTPLTGAATKANAQLLLGVLALDETTKASGKEVEVVRFGRARAKAGATITPGTHYWLTCNSDGEVIPATVGTDQIVGYFIGLVAAADGLPCDIFVNIQP